MAERVFTANELWQNSVISGSCECLQCRLGSLFARHLDCIRASSFPTPSCVLGHERGPAENDGGHTLVPHMVQVDIGPGLDIIVWERMSPKQLAVWLPPSSDAEHLDEMVQRLPAIVAIRSSHRLGTIILDDTIEAAIREGHYLSVRFLLEHWQYFRERLGGQHVTG